MCRFYILCPNTYYISYVLLCQWLKLCYCTISVLCTTCYIDYVLPKVSHVPSNGLSLLYGISISNVPLKALDELY
jgi:hypothetical protein